MSYKGSGMGHYTSKYATIDAPTKLDELLKKTIAENSRK